ncbi:GTP cyclohydrolase 1-like [Lytechinus pictus]|uniref:GTP cyclohydrolase 1-like n=1 Tax=Lytechinus pictus TaxID=7653 RepID=UPI0030BA0845
MSIDHADSVPNGEYLPNGHPSMSSPGGGAREDSTDILAAKTNNLSLKDSNFQGRVSSKEEEDRARPPKTKDPHATLYRQDSDKQLPGLALAYRSIIRGVGEDASRQGLRKTPDRAAKAMMFFTKGYEEKVEGFS